MIYKIYASNGDRLSIEADTFVSDGSGVKLNKNGQGTIAMFWPGEVVRIFPEGSIEEAEVITNED